MKPIRFLLTFFLSSIVLSASAIAALVLHLPLDDASSGGVTVAAASINDTTHPTTSGTSTGTGDAWTSNATRGKVYYSNQGSRLTAGTQGIDRTIGFTWTMWVNLDPTAAGNADAGADVIIGTRNGATWHKVQRTSTDKWTSMGFGSADLMTNTWKLLAYVGDITSVRIYIDGAFAGLDTTTPTSTYNEVFEIGGSLRFTEDSEGLFSDLGVWNEALTANEAKGLYDIIILSTMAEKPASGTSAPRITKTSPQIQDRSIIRGNFMP